MSVKGKRTQLTVKDTSTALIARNEIFDLGVLVIESDTDVIKSGDGKTAYNLLSDLTGDKPFKAADRTKLDEIQPQATKNSTDAQLRDRATHTGNIPATNVTESSAKRFVTDAEKAAYAAGETVTTLGTKINGAANKTTPVDADKFVSLDSAASNVIKTFTWATIKTWLKTHFDTIYPAMVGGVIPLDKIEEEPLLPKFDGMIEVGSKLRVDPEYISTNWIDLVLNKRWGGWFGRHGDSNIGGEFARAMSGVGTATARSYGVSDKYSLIPKIAYVPVTGVTANQSVSLRNSAGLFSMQEGFTIQMMYCASDSPIASLPNTISLQNVVNARSFNGLCSLGASLTASTDITAQAMSALGIGNNGGDTNLSIISGVSGALLKTDLGSNFPAQTKDIIIATFDVAPTETEFTYSVTRYDRVTGAKVGSTATGISTNVPAQTTILYAQLFRSNGSTPLDVQLDMSYLIYQKPNLF